MNRRIWLVADDFGLSPGVDDAILELLANRAISGTGCMTVFDDWAAEAKRLQAVRPDRAGIHLTLTDQPALTGTRSLAPQGKLPTLGRLVSAVSTGRIAEPDIHAELSAQWQRFQDVMGRTPAYIDGHQHVHFLPAVRRWLKQHAGAAAWVRGTPGQRNSPLGSRLRIATVRTLATGFDATMQRAGFAVMAPLAGFYDWSKGRDFAETIAHGIRSLPNDGVLMCHPGIPDQVLRDRDALVEARATEFAFLGSRECRALFAQYGAEIA